MRLSQQRAASSRAIPVAALPRPKTVSSNSRMSLPRTAGAGLLPALNASAFFNFPFTSMFNRFKHLFFGTAALLGAMTLSEAQNSSSAPAPKSLAATTDSQAKPATAPALPAAPSAKISDNSPLTLVQASTTSVAPAPTTAPKSSPTSTTTLTTSEQTEAESAIESGGVGVREFQGDDV